MICVDALLALHPPLPPLFFCVFFFVSFYKLPPPPVIRLSAHDDYSTCLITQDHNSCCGKVFLRAGCRGDSLTRCSLRLFSLSLFGDWRAIFFFFFLSNATQSFKQSVTQDYLFGGLTSSGSDNTKPK